MKIKFTVIILLSFLSLFKISAQYQQYSSSSEIDPECYCHFEFDYYELIDYYAILAEAQRQAWLNERELEFKEEIESRINQQFSSFDQAQKEFFKRRFASYGAAPYYQAQSNEFVVESKELTLQRDITFPRYKALELRYNDLLENGQYDAEYDFGAIQYYGQQFESHSLSYIISSKSNRLDQYNENQFPLSNLYLRSDKLLYVKNNKLLEDYIAGRFVNHYNQHNSVDQVELMSKYLILDNVFPPYALPQWGPATYNMAAYNYDSNLWTLINNANIDPDPISDPNLNPDEIIKRFAITSLDPYESGDSFISELVFSDTNLTQKTGNYLDYHSFRAESLGLAKEFFTKMLNNQNFSRPTAFYRGTSVGRQTEDRETRIFNASLTTAASDADFARFTDVIAAFAENPENYKYEGYIMRQMITSNYLNIPSVLSNEDLGRLFDFQTNSSYLTIRFSNDVDYGGLFHRDGEYGWDLFEDPFKIAALDEMARGGYADFNKDIMTTKAFRENPCLNSIFESLDNISIASSFLNKFSGDSPVARLKLSTGVDSTSPSASAVTYNPVNYVIEIKFNTNNLNRSKTSVARTFIHELIHAEMFRKLLSVAQQPEIPWTKAFIESIRNDYEGISDYYLRWYFNLPEGQGPSDPQHQLMAQHKIDVIKNFLMEFDPFLTENEAEALSWDGLMITRLPNQTPDFNPQTGLFDNAVNNEAWKLLSPSERISIRNTIINYENTHPDC
jgi:hypothetical protein